MCRKERVSEQVEILKGATAGTLESSDVFVQVEPNKAGVELFLQSVVMNQFGQEIERVIQEVLQENNVKNVSLTINDRGAVECVLRARIETALKRGQGGK